MSEKKPETVVQSKAEHNPSALSLFSGAGGMDIGIMQAGFDILACVEIDPYCCESQVYPRFINEKPLSWGGKTIWVVQDLLVDYICTSTALNVRQFLSENTSEVNMLSFSYGTAFKITRGVVELLNPQLFAGLIASKTADSTQPMPSFQDIIRAPTCPPLDRVMVALVRRKPINQVIAP